MNIHSMTFGLYGISAYGLAQEAQVNPQDGASEANGNMPASNPMGSSDAGIQDGASDANRCPIISNDSGFSAAPAAAPAEAPVASPAPAPADAPIAVPVLADTPTATPAPAPIPADASIASPGAWAAASPGAWAATSEKIGQLWDKFAGVVVPVVRNPTVIAASTAVVATESARKCYTNYQNRDYKYAAGWGAVSLLASAICVHTIITNPVGMT